MVAQETESTGLRTGPFSVFQQKIVGKEKIPLKKIMKDHSIKYEEKQQRLACLRCQGSGGFATAE